MEGVVYLICWTSILWMFSWWVTLLVAAWNEDKDSKSCGKKSLHVKR